MTINPYSATSNIYGLSGTGRVQNAGAIATQGSGATHTAGLSTAQASGIGTAQGGENVRGTGSSNGVDRECQTCKERKYQDGSDEMVSFKSATHIAPEAAAVRVRAHEQEHVSNAYKKAAQGNGEVIRASVTIHRDICPECGRSYVSGGTTETQIKYTNEENPYQQMLKSADAYKYKGMNVDMAV